jgi:signal transduction histidine kinase
MLAVSSTAMVALAFVIPLGLLVRTLAEDRALTEARQLAQLLAPALATGGDAALTVALQTAESASDDLVTVFRADGQVLGAPAVADALVERARGGEAFTEDLAGSRVLLTPLLEADGRTAVVRVEVPGDRLTAGVIPAWAVMLGLGAALVAGAVVLADRLARAVVEPATEAAAAARALAGGDRGARAPVSGPPEIADLAAALNTLADRIEALLTAEREAAADLSHRLRTPLTVLRLDVEALEASPRTGRIAADLDALEREVDRVIRDARRTPAATTVTVDAAAVVGGRVRFWAALAEEEGRHWSLDDPPTPAPVAAPADELEAAVDALLGNVFAHTPDGTGFSVAIRIDGRQVLVVVSDEGPGFGDHAVLDRGVSAGGSTGLGLDIARRTAERHGGGLELGSSDGGGARVTLRLPLAS